MDYKDLAARGEFKLIKQLQKKKKRRSAYRLNCKRRRLGEALADEIEIEEVLFKEASGGMSPDEIECSITRMAYYCKGRRLLRERKKKAQKPPSNL